MRSLHSRGLRYLLVSIALPLVIAGCTADLPEGTFFCNVDAECPSEWRCYPDERCYPPDFPGLDYYEPCLVDTDCRVGTCLAGFVPEATFGRCSETTCAESTDCPTNADGRVGVCGVGRGCFASCESNQDCADAETCAVVPMTEGVTGCIDLRNREYAGTDTCTQPMGDCSPGAMCILATSLDPTGVCAWPCDPSTSCPSGTACVELSSAVIAAQGGGMRPRFFCLATCSETIPGDCGEELDCVRFPDANDDPRCIPPGW